MKDSLGRVLGRILIVVSLNGCIVQLNAEGSNSSPERFISCTSDEDCPQSQRCETSIPLCLPPASAEDAQAPALLVPAVFSPSIGTLNTDFNILLESSEPLYLPPKITLDSGQTFFAVARSSTLFQFQHSVDTIQNNQEINALLVDLAGNTALIDLGPLPIDAEAPELSNLAWIDAPPQIGPTSILAFSAATSLDAEIGLADLINQNDEVLLQALVTGTSEGGALNLRGMVDLNLLEPGALLNTSELSLRLDIRDNLGNTPAAENTEFPWLDVDAQPPTTTFSIPPPTHPTSRRLSFEFEANEDEVDFVCQLDDKTAFPCDSPLHITVTTGIHSLKILARDKAGNRELTPLESDFQVSPVWQDVETRANAICAIASDESLWCWGGASTTTLYTDFTSNAPYLISDELHWSKIFPSAAVDDPAICALQDDNQGSPRAFCFGEGPLGLGNDAEYTILQELNSEPSEPWIELSLSAEHRCGIKADASLWCWGNNRDQALGQLAPIDYLLPQAVGTNLDWQSVSTARGYTCGIRNISDERRIFCFGQERGGRLGNGLSYEGPEPTLVGDPLSGEVLRNWLQIEIDEEYACAIHEDIPGSAQGSLWCWGDANEGSLGVESESDVTLPQRVGTQSTWTQLSIAEKHACALQSEGSAFCWGSDRDGQLRPDQMSGQDSPTPSQVPHPTGEAWAKIVAGFGYTCGLSTSGHLICFGENGDGQLGGGESGFDDQELERVGPTSTWQSVSSGSSVACAIQNSPQPQTLWCWGDGSYGANGDKDTGHSLPQQVGVHNDWLSISHEEGHSCGLRESTPGKKSAWCFGSDIREQLGDEVDNFFGISTPVQVGIIGAQKDDWLQIVAADDASLGIRDDDGMQTLWTWGRPSWESDDIVTPQLIPGLLGWKQIDMDRDHACGIVGDGPSASLWCIGEGDRGKLGLGDEDDQTSFQQLAVGEAHELAWVEVSTATSHTCAIRNEGAELWCWGEAFSGALGLGDLSNLVSTNLPMQLAGDGWQTVQATRRGTCALKTDGSLWCWGGVAGGDDADAPQRVGEANNWASLSARGSNVCAINTTAELFCMGPNARGELGNGRAFGPFDIQVPNP